MNKDEVAVFSRCRCNFRNALHRNSRDKNETEMMTVEIEIMLRDIDSAGKLLLVVWIPGSPEDKKQLFVS